MTQYYNSQRTWGIYDPNLNNAQNGQVFKLSRSKIDLFLGCPRCFYYDRRLGVARPPGFPFSLNAAVDALLKKEFDAHRTPDKIHPLLAKYGVDAKPVANENLDKWRHNFTGVQFLHKPTNFLVFGAIDDLWQNSKGEFIVVDYKATAKKEEIKELDKDWQDGYKRQMEIYQWLLRQNGYNVSGTGYFVYCNGIADAEAFDAKLEFRITLIPYKGDDSWVEKAILNIHKCLNSDEIPEPDSECDYCNYVKAINGRIN